MRVGSAQLRARAAFAAGLVLGTLAGAAGARGQIAPRPEIATVDIPSLPSARAAGAPDALPGVLFRPPGAGPFAALVGLHGCGGLYARRRAPQLDARFADWGERLARAGYAVLFPDSFAPRGLREICSASATARPVDAAHGRPEDAEAALAWLAGQGFVRPDALGVIGWSNGAMTVLALIDAARPRPRDGAGVLRAAVAFYPGCRAQRAARGWMPRVPLQILMGDADDWTPAGPCRDLVAAVAARGLSIGFTVYPGALHDFDHPDLPRRVLNGVGGTRSGQATLGSDPAARADALVRVPAFLAAVLPP